MLHNDPSMPEPKPNMQDLFAANDRNFLSNKSALRSVIIRIRSYFSNILPAFFDQGMCFASNVYILSLITTKKLPVLSVDIAP